MCKEIVETIFCIDKSQLIILLLGNIEGKISDLYFFLFENEKRLLSLEKFI